MYDVWTTTDTCDNVFVFSGTLEECLAYTEGDSFAYIVEPDGYTVYGE